MTPRRRRGERAAPRPGERSPRPTTSIPGLAGGSPPTGRLPKGGDQSASSGPPTGHKPRPGSGKGRLRVKRDHGVQDPSRTAVSSAAARNGEKASPRPPAHPRAAGGAAAIPGVVPDAEPLIVFSQLSLHLSRGSSPAGGNRIWCKRLAHWQHPPRLRHSFPGPASVPRGVPTRRALVLKPQTWNGRAHPSRMDMAAEW